MAGKGQAKSSKKHGRNLIKCKKYKDESRREKNKKARIEKRKRKRLNWLKNKVRKGTATEKQIIELRNVA